jgi:hypothetical protein
MAHKKRKLTAEEVARLGDDIYERVIRKKIERKCHGKVVAIDVLSEQYEIGENALVACRALRGRVPDAEVCLVRVGYRALHHLLGMRLECHHLSETRRPVNRKLALNVS